MIAEEIGLNDALEADGIEPVETDLGEYIIQLRGEMPSPHHRARRASQRKEQVEADFRRVHTHLAAGARPLRAGATADRGARRAARAVSSPPMSASPARIFSIAETGTSIIVTNEGNGDLTQILPKVHIVLASIEKIVPTLEDVAQILRVLARSATGQDMSVYTTLSTGPRRPGDPDGPEDITSSSSTTAARRCSAASSRTCCAASAAAPA